MAPPVRPMVHLAVLGALLVLVGVSWAATHLLPAPWGLVAALAIAGAKGLLVVLIFMNLRGRPLRFAVALALALGLGATLAGLVVGDVALRQGDLLWTEHSTGNGQR